MQLKRLFTTADVKGTRNYLNIQKKYEVARTIIYFGISLTLFIAGYIQTGERTNLLTIVAILGCLPASKSAVNAIMFCRFKSCSQETAESIAKCLYSNGQKNVTGSLYDCIFTSYKKNFLVAHLVVRGNSICGYSEDKNFAENEFYKHIGDILKLDGHKDITVKIFTDLSKYINRLEQLKELEPAAKSEDAIIATLKSVSL